MLHVIYVLHLIYILYLIHTSTAISLCYQPLNRPLQTDLDCNTANHISQLIYKSTAISLCYQSLKWPLQTDCLQWPIEFPIFLVGSQSYLVASQRL